MLFRSFFKRQGRRNSYLEEWTARRTPYHSQTCKKWKREQDPQDGRWWPVRKQMAKLSAVTNGAICSRGILSKSVSLEVSCKKKKTKKTCLNSCLEGTGPLSLEKFTKIKVVSPRCSVNKWASLGRRTSLNDKELLIWKKERTRKNKVGARESEREREWEPIAGVSQSPR